VFWQIATIRYNNSTKSGALAYAIKTKKMRKKTKQLQNDYKT